MQLERSANSRFESYVVPAQELDPADVRAWDGLCSSRTHLSSPFLTPHYAKAVARVKPDVYVCVITRDKRAVGFLPFQFRNRFHRLLRSAERVGEEMTDYFGMVAEPGVKLGQQAVLQLAGLQSLSFTHLDETQLDYGFAAEKPEIGYVMRMDAPESYWGMLRRTHKEFVTNTERRQRQVEAQFGPLRFTPAEQDWQEPLRNLIEHKARQYGASGRDNIFDVAWKNRFVETLAACREQTCTGMLSTLYAGDTWLASHFGLRGGNILHYWFPVYNPELSRFGPGRLFLKMLIERAPEIDIQIIDHGAGDARYKQESSNSSHTYYRGSWHAVGIRSLILRATQSAKWRLEKLRAT